MTAPPQILQSLLALLLKHQGDPCRRITSDGQIKSAITIEVARDHAHGPSVGGNRDEVGKVPLPCPHRNVRLPESRSVRARSSTPLERKSPATTV
jgi:hypothetical protein